MNSCRRLTVLLVACAMPLLGSDSAYALAARDSVEVDERRPRLAVSPPRTLAEAPPGRRLRAEVVVRNYSPQAFTIYLSTTDLVASVDPSTLAEPSPRRQTASWFTPDVSTARLRGGESLRVGVTIDVPADARPGAHAAAVLVSRRLTRPAATSGAGARVTIDASVGAQFLLSVPGRAQVGYRIGRLRSPRWVMPGSRPRFSAELRNTGDTLLRANSDMLLGSFIGTSGGRIKGTETLALPDGRRRLGFRWNDPPFAGWFKPTLVVDVNGEKTTRRYPDVVVLPPWWFLGALVAAAMLPLWLRRRRRPHR